MKKYVVCLTPGDDTWEIWDVITPRNILVRFLSEKDCKLCCKGLNIAYKEEQKKRGKAIQESFFSRFGSTHKKDECTTPSPTYTYTKTPCSLSAKNDKEQVNELKHLVDDLKHKLAGVQKRLCLLEQQSDIVSVVDTSEEGENSTC